MPKPQLEKTLVLLFYIFSTIQFLIYLLLDWCKNRLGKYFGLKTKPWASNTAIMSSGSHLWDLVALIPCLTLLGNICTAISTGHTVVFVLPIRIKVFTLLVSTIGTNQVWHLAQVTKKNERTESCKYEVNTGNSSWQWMRSQKKKIKIAWWKMKGLKSLFWLLDLAGKIFEEWNRKLGRWISHKIYHKSKYYFFCTSKATILFS